MAVRPVAACACKVERIWVSRGTDTAAAAGGAAGVAVGGAGAGAGADGGAAVFVVLLG